MEIMEILLTQPLRSSLCIIFHTFLFVFEVRVFDKNKLIGDINACATWCKVIRIHM